MAEDLNLLKMLFTKLLPSEHVISCSQMDNMKYKKNQLACLGNVTTMSVIVCIVFISENVIYF